MISLSHRHGHVQPHPHGLKARCGGPAICSHCQQEERELRRQGTTDRERLAALEAEVDGLREEVDALRERVERIEARVLPYGGAK